MDARTIVSKAKQKSGEIIRRATLLIRKGHQRFSQLTARQRYYSLAGFALLVVAIVVIAIAGQRKSITTVPYVSNQGAFTIEATDSGMHLTTDQFPFLDQQVKRFTHENASPEMVYRVIHFDLPPGLISLPDYINTLNMLAAIFVIPFNGIISSTREISLQGYQGVTITAEGRQDDQAFRGEAMLVIVANRIYMVGVYGQRRGYSSREANRFINSFKFNF